MSDESVLEHHKPIRVSIFTQFYPPDYAAAGQLIEELAVELGHLGYQLHIFTGQPGYAFHNKSAPKIDRSEQVSVQRSHAARLWPKQIGGKAVNGVLFCLRSGLYLLKLVLSNINRSRSSDLLIFTTVPPFLPFLGYLFNLVFGLPYICLIYDLYPDIPIELKVLQANQGLVRLWDFLNRCTWKKAKKIIVISPAMKQRVAAKCPAITDKIAVIHNWADSNKIVPIAKHKNWFAHQFNLVEKFTVLYSGNMGRCHDMHTILETARILQNEAIQFVFIGNGAKRQALIDQASQLGLKNCLFLPYQNKKTLPYSLTACDLSLVSVSRGMEGLVMPSKFYAALAAGRPIAVICEQDSDLCQMVTEANCGAAFTNGDSAGIAEFIRRLASDSQLAQQLGNASRRYLESNFTPEIISKQYSKVLSEAVLETLKPRPRDQLAVTRTISRV